MFYIFSVLWQASQAETQCSTLFLRQETFSAVRKKADVETLLDKWRQNKTEMLAWVSECSSRDFGLDRQGVLYGECQWACQCLQLNDLG